MTWDAAQYLKFAGERLRPALDLMARMDWQGAGTLYDLGCGTGTGTRLLADRWPDAAVTGVDSSPDMLARAEDGRVRWLQADVATWSPGAPVDVLFSNAAFNWLDDHEALFPRLMSHLKPGGLLAVQMPNNHDRPSHTAMADVAAAGPWKDVVFPHLRLSPVHGSAFYHDVLWPLADTVDIWQTEYLHILDGDDPVADWTRGTALKPLLDAAGDHGDAFYAAYAERMAAAYPKRPDGKTPFPFKRLFVVARRAA